jgi:glycosyltransferase involved in cell wall biosynthesis
MKIGVAGPIDLGLLLDLFPPASCFPATFSFPVTAHLARELHRRGHEITLFTLSREVARTQRIEGDRITAYICPQRRPRMQMLDWFRKECHGLRDAMRASGCSVIHAHWTYEFGLAAVESGIPHVVTAHDNPIAALRFARHPYWLVKPLLAWPVLRRARCVTAVSPYIAKTIRRYVRRGREIVVVPNGVTQKIVDRFADRRPRAEGEPFRFAGIMNGWSALKNGNRLLEAFANLRREFGQKVELLLCGHGHEEQGGAHRWATSHQLTDGVEFLGEVPFDALMNRLARDVDVLVHPSLEESFCMAAAEAMAMGIPVIGGQHSGGIPWVLGDGKVGLLVDVTSSTAISKGMRELFVDTALRESLASAGRERVLNNYRLHDVARQYEDILSRASQEQRQ